LENHDEPRAAHTFAPAQHAAAAVLTFLAPGLRFFHQGQLEGWVARISPHLGRGPAEPTNACMAHFSRRLMAVLRRATVRDGQWQLLECVPAFDGDGSSGNFIAYSWEEPSGERLLVAVNYASAQSQCYVRLPFSGLGSRRWLLRDLLGEARYERAGDDLQGRGLYLNVPPWQHHVFELSPAPAGETRLDG